MAYTGVYRLSDGTIVPLRSDIVSACRGGFVTAGGGAYALATTGAVVNGYFTVTGVAPVLISTGAVKIFDLNLVYPSVCNLAVLRATGVLEMYRYNLTKLGNASNIPAPIVDVVPLYQSLGGAYSAALLTTGEVYSCVASGTYWSKAGNIAGCTKLGYESALFDGSGTALLGPYYTGAMPSDRWPHFTARDTFVNNTDGSVTGILRTPYAQTSQPVRTWMPAGTDVDRVFSLTVGGYLNYGALVVSGGDLYVASYTEDYVPDVGMVIRSLEGWPRTLASLGLSPDISYATLGSGVMNLSGLFLTDNHDSWWMNKEGVLEG